MKKIQIMVDGLKDVVPKKNCGDCIRNMYSPLADKCWELGLHESITNEKTLIVCNRIKVIQQDLHKTEEEKDAETYERFRRNS